MSLADQLLVQAERLASVDRRRPVQVNLRRAESAAYYAVFHELTGDAARLFVRGSNRTVHRDLVRRSFSHVRMAEICRDFDRGAAWIRLAGIDPPAELVDVATLFVLLQQRRHEADYDLSLVLQRAHVQRTLRFAQSALGTWRSIRRTPEAEFFLLALLLGRSRRA